MSFQSLDRSGIARALAISAALHFLLLWPSPPSRQEAIPAARLDATLRTPPAAPALPVRAAPHVLAARKPSDPLPRRLEQPETPPPAPVSAPDAQPTSPPASTGLGAGRSGPAAPIPAAAQAPSEGTVDADGLRSYRLALASQARGHRRYPRQAEDAGWEGTAEVRVKVLAGGVAQEPELLHSSGHAVLDRAAVDMLRSALPLTPVPPVLRQQSFVVDLPVVFELPE